MQQIICTTGICFFGLYPSPLCFLNHNVSRDGPSLVFAQLEYMTSVLSTQWPPIEASSISWTQQSRFHLRTREEPSLEMLWFKKHKGDG
jgi:hypothetical protein